MEISNSIAALSVSMSAAKVQQQASLSVMKKAMDTQETAAANTIELLQTAVPPQGKMDISV